jgi:hypothetical protein
MSARGDRKRAQRARAIKRIKAEQKLEREARPGRRKWRLESHEARKLFRNLDEPTLRRAA